jgi:gamma-glutamyl:cysteine ligase YbdK (ATP-grasp superfamily)
VPPDASDPSDGEPSLGLFQGYGVEIEYMIADASTLDVRPIADALLGAEHGAVEDEITRGDFAWSNELVRHVIELKTSAPVATLAGVADGFAGEIAHIGGLLAPMGARLLPSAMHPWMDPSRELALWPHGDRDVYEAFHRIFDCRGHGWANLQSAHLNLPFASDAEFGRLHAAARALLPILPALAASSPFVEGRHTDLLDTRVEVYRTNARRVPSVTGQVVPEPVFTFADYRALLETIYRDLAPQDPEGTLRHEWVNARGCIARFERMAIEIRVIDVQECPQADLAIAAAASLVLRALCDPAAAHQRRLRSLDTRALAAILHATAARGGSTKIEDRDYLRALGVSDAPRTAAELWAELVERHVASERAAAEHAAALDTILAEGCLAARLLRRVGAQPSHAELFDLYRELADCLDANALLRAA